MNTMTKMLATSFAMSLLAGCAIPEIPDLKLPEIPQDMASLLKSEERTKYTGTDSVGDVDPGVMVGSWQVENVNGTSIEKKFNLQITFNNDQTLTGAMNADMGETFGKFDYGIKGTWSVDGEYVNIDSTTATEKSGNALAQSAGTIFDEGGVLGNVYEVSANKVIVFDEETGVAQAFTRLN